MMYCKNWCPIKLGSHFGHDYPIWHLVLSIYRIKLMESQMEKNMEREMHTGYGYGFHRICTVGTS